MNGWRLPTFEEITGIDNLSRNKLDNNIVNFNPIDDTHYLNINKKSDWITSKKDSADKYYALRWIEKPAAGVVFS